MINNNVVAIGTWSLNLVLLAIAIVFAVMAIILIGVMLVGLFGGIMSIVEGVKNDK